MGMRLLGPFEVLGKEGQSITPRPAKMRTLLALLCAYAGTVVSTQQIEAALWVEGRPRTAATALHVYMSRVRKHLEGHGAGSVGISTRASGYVLNDGVYDLDHQSLRRLVQRADDAEAAGRTAEAVEILQRATALRRGPALADFRDVPVLNSVGRHLDEQFLLAYGRKAELELRLNRHARLVPELFAVATEYPTHEHIHQLLMLCLYRTGRTAEALSVYTRLREHLIEAVGLEPSARSQRLQQRILQFDTQLDEANALAS
ncbi:SARP transcriptional activator [Couchioplanes caeruleus subsp. caeruleus]|uniref:SARP transcriptional activator n=1 Tax=Couchioplanes caeruleus subsp. caeruleus TaxID=56427 RepID=A0A1K0GXH0_9ACTN|nr:SARP transcriptional activator [Couchioplanes caeruleus subsp. caeruleus]